MGHSLLAGVLLTVALKRETDTMNTSYTYGDGKTYDSANFVRVFRISS